MRDEAAKTAVNSGNDNVVANAETVIGVCLAANTELSKQLMEDETMDPVRELFKKEFEQSEARGEERGKQQMVEEMLKDRESAKKIAKWSGWSLEKIASVAEKNGIASLVL